MADKYARTEEHTTRVGNTLRQAGHKLDKLGERAGNKSDELIQQGQEMASQLQKGMEEYGSVVVDYIKKNPVKSALIAGGVGLILAKLLRM